MKIKNLCLSLFAICLLLGNSGCAVLLVGGGAAAGAGAVAYVRGELKSTQVASLKDSFNASEAALTELGFAITIREENALTAKLTARGTEDKKIELFLKKISDALTEIRIRVGTFGDETISRAILDKIQSKLGGEKAPAASENAEIEKKDASAA